MKDDQLTIQIHGTYDYDLFECILSNREIQWLRVETLRKEFANKYFKLSACLNVKERITEEGKSKLMIMNGQHTFYAAREDGRIIWYYVSEKMEEGDIPRLNSQSKSWTLRDYLHHYTVVDSHPYKVFKGYMERHGFGPSICLRILLGERGKEARQTFISGNLDSRVMNTAFGEEFASMIHDFSDYIPFNKMHRFMEGLLYIVRNHKDKYSHKKMMTKMVYASSMLKKQPDTMAYVRVFENIYNYKSRGNKVHFD